MKSENDNDDDDDEPEFKIKKEIPSTSTYEYNDSSQEQTALQQSPIKVKKEDLWYQLEENGGQLKDLLQNTGMIKNSSKLRFDVKEISLTEDV